MGIPGMIIEKDLSQLTQTTVVSFLSEPVGQWPQTNHYEIIMYTFRNML